MATIANNSLDTLKPLLIPNYAAQIEAGFSKVNALTICQFPARIGAPTGLVLPWLDNKQPNSKVVSEGNKRFFRKGREAIELGETGQFDHSSQDGP